MVGGNNGKINFGTIHKYDFRANKWENLKIKRNQGLFKGRFGHTTIYFNESIYIFGGWADKKRRNDLLKFDFHKAAWVKEEVGDEHYMPSERDFHASVLQDNYFYIIGGSDKKVKLNEIHRIKIKDEKPSTTLSKDFGRLLDQLSEDHFFSDCHITFSEKEGDSKETVFSYYPLVSRRAPKILEDSKRIEGDEAVTFEAH